ncbi:hypothetical protein EDB83DRAFT_1844427 [Lactarius deliciosus]|nr:hypothetical protein EDB83DRAFT_1844427 [Lactarius deliciosus]
MCTCNVKPKGDCKQAQVSATRVRRQYCIKASSSRTTMRLIALLFRLRLLSFREKLSRLAVQYPGGRIHLRDTLGDISGLVPKTWMGTRGLRLFCSCFLKVIDKKSMKSVPSVATLGRFSPTLDISGATRSIYVKIRLPGVIIPPPTKEFALAVHTNGPNLTGTV